MRSIGELNLNNIYCMDTRDGLRMLPDESVQCCVTSSPYLGLRSYETPPVLWGGDHNCEHEWIQLQPRRARTANDKGTSSVLQNSNSDFDLSGGDRCVHCGGWKGELGDEPDPDLFINHLAEVFAEVHRVLRPDGTFWINIADTHWAGKGWSGGASEEDFRRRGTPTLQQAHHHIGGRGKMRGIDYKHPFIKPKDLVGIPWRLAFAMQGFAVVPAAALDNAADILAEAREKEDWEAVLDIERMLRINGILSRVLKKSFWVRCDIIWNATNTIPESVDTRPSINHEYIFLLAKSGSTLFWAHRDGRCVRQQPEPDYVWKDNSVSFNTSPSGANTGANNKAPNKNNNPHRQRLETGETEETRTPPDNWKTELMSNGKRRWSRRNLWEGHDYFYDADAIRRPHTLSSKLRSLRGRNESKYSPLHPRLNMPSGRLPSASKEIVDDIVDAGETGLHPMGANFRSVWSASTANYKGSHVAGFPVELPELAIKAGTSAKGACPNCGAPWVRLKHHVTLQPTRMHSKDYGRNDGTTHGGFNAVDIHMGWSPSCDCRDEDGNPLPPVPCVVLDPFIGSGTTAVACRTATPRRDFIGFDNNPEYVKEALARLKLYNKGKSLLDC